MEGMTKREVAEHNQNHRNECRWQLWEENRETRLQRSPAQQLLELDKRPGNSARERKRLLEQGKKK